MKKAGTAVLERFKSKEIDYVQLYNNVPEKAPAFKGRILLKYRIATKRPSKYETPAMVPFRLKIKDRPREPPSTEYRYVITYNFQIYSIFLCKSLSICIG